MQTEQGVVVLKCRSLAAATAMLDARGIRYDKVIGDKSQACFWDGESPAARFVATEKNRGNLEIYGDSK